MKIKTYKGFTLIELLIAISILSIIVLSFFTVINTSIKSNVKNEKDIMALNIAQSEVEYIRKQIKSNKTSFISTEGTILSLESDNLVLKNVGGLSYTIKINLNLSKKISSEDASIANEQYNNLYDVSVTVSPDKFSNKSTYIATQISK